MNWLHRLLKLFPALSLLLVALQLQTYITPTYAQGVVLVGAGDIAACSLKYDEATAALLDKIDGIVFTLGDNVYLDGREKNYMECYEPSWGRFKARTRPVPGNHDYQNAGEVPYYFQYFGENAGEPGKGYYSYNVGGWHVIALNSMIPIWQGTEQEHWLRADLAANPSPCILAYFHHPVFHSGVGGISGRTLHAFRVLYEAGASVVLSGDAHHYERFAPMNPNKRIEPERGIRQFIVGTGGAVLTTLGPRWPATEVRNNDTHGVLKLALYPGGYSWEFIPVEGKTFTDSGSAACAQKPPEPTPTPTPTPESGA